MIPWIRARFAASSQRSLGIGPRFGRVLLQASTWRRASTTGSGKLAFDELLTDDPPRCSLQRFEDIHLPGSLQARLPKIAPGDCRTGTTSASTLWGHAAAAHPHGPRQAGLPKAHLRQGTRLPPLGEVRTDAPNKMSSIAAKPHHPAWAPSSRMSRHCFELARSRYQRTATG